MGWKVVTIIEAHGWEGGAISTDWPMPAYESLSFGHVFKPCQFKHSKECKTFKQKKQKSWIEYSFELNWVLCTRREPRLTDSNTEPSSPLPPPAPERTNTNRSLNIQTEKDAKEPNSAPVRGVLCAQDARMRDASQSSPVLHHRICLFLLLYRHILKQTVGYVLSQSNQLRKKLYVHHYIGCIVS